MSPSETVMFCNGLALIPSVTVNETGGELVNSTVQGGTLYQSYNKIFNITYFVGGGRKPAFSIVSGRTWEDDRGVRCDFWRSIGGIVPE